MAVSDIGTTRLTARADDEHGAEDFLLRTARALSSARCESMYDDLTIAVTELLDCDIGLLGLYLEVDGVPSIRTLSCYANGRLQAFGTYALHGTPCETVVGQEFRIFPRDVAFSFPDIDDLDKRISGYAAYPLFDRAHRTLGILVVMKYSEIRAAGRVESLLRLFAERAAVEIERQAVAAALRASEEQYRAIFNASVDGLALFRPDGVVVDVNPAIERLYLYHRDELLGHNIYEYLAQAHLPESVAFVAEVMRQGFAHSEHRARRKDGTLFHAHSSGIRMDYRGAPHILGIIRDVSESRRRAHALKVSEDRLRATVQASLDCIISLDEQGLVLDFNPAAEVCFGYRREQVLGGAFSELAFPPQCRAQIKGELDRYLASGQGPHPAQRIEILAMRADSREFPAELVLAMAGSERSRIFVAYLRDITDRLVAEEQRLLLEGQLRQAQKMEAIGQLTGGIAHDFNNILTSVMGYVHLAAERVSELDDERLHRYLARAQRSGERARDLIAQMLTFSRGQQGEPRRLRLQPVIEEGMALLDSTMPASIRIERRFARELPAVVIDPLHVEQILVNLCINARDAMGGSGELSIELRHARQHNLVCASCRQAASGEFVELVVGDSGTGIHAELVDRIFEPFFSTKDVSKGSGMGLATVHGIVHEYGGHIVVESVVGRGTRFRILLPADNSGLAHAALMDAGVVLNPAGALSGRVLIVDDNFVVGEFLEELLTSWGLEVTSFGNGLGAYHEFVRDPQIWDLVIVDQTMPQMTGTTLASQLLELRPTLPVVLYTGYGDGLSETSLRQLGIRALVRKPLEVHAFRGLLEDILQAS